MVHGRIETTPEQQLIDLRKAYDRYVKLADLLHDSGDAALDADERQAREHYARRIAHAYEKSIANTSARMESMRQGHMADHSFRRWMVIAVLIVIAVLFASSALLAAFLPEIFHPVPPRPVRSTPPVPVASASTPAPVVAPDLAPVLPPAPQPVITPRAPAANNAARRTNAATPAPMARPVTASSAKVETPKANTPRVATPTREAPPPARVAEAPRVTLPPQIFTPPAAVAPAPTPAPPAVIATAAPNPPPVATTSPAVASSAPANTPAPVLRDTSVQTAALPPVAAPAPAARAPTPASVLTRLEAIASTHRPPPYPDMSKRAGEQGTTQMQVAISTAGVITDCNVTGTSGSQRLDAAACSYVQAHWRWQPPLKDGQPASITTRISVIWSLATAAR